MCKTITANQKLIKQLNKYHGRLISPRMEAKALKLYLANLSQQAKRAKNALQATSNHQSVTYLPTILALLKSQKSVDLSNPTATKYLNKLKNETVVGRKTIERFINKVNAQSLKKAHHLEHIMSHVLVPNIIKDWTDACTKKIKERNQREIKEFTQETSGLAKVVLHKKYQKSIQKIKQVNEKKCKDSLEMKLFKIRNCFSNYRGVESIIDNFLNFDEWCTHDKPLTPELQLFFTKDVPTHVVNNTVESNVVNNIVDGGGFFSHYTYDEKTNQIFYSNKKPVKYASDFFKLMVLEVHLVYLPYVSSPKLISTKSCFASDLNVVDVFCRNSFFYGNYSKLRTDDPFNNDLLISDTWLSPSALPKIYNIVADGQAWIDYRTFIKNN